MAVTQAVLGYGSLLQRGDVATATNFSTIAEVRTIDGPKLTKDRKEVTHMLSPNGYKEYLGGLKDGGDLTFTLNFIPSASTQNAVTGVIADFEANTKRYHRIVWPTNPSYSSTFQAEVMDIDIKTPIDDAITMDITMKLSAAPTWA